MIITRTPFRISFFGGGTDYPVYFRKYGGAVLSTAINHYCYITLRKLPPFFDYKYSLRYSLSETSADLDSIRHSTVRECLRFLDYPHAIEMTYSGDIPASSGIASSSSFCVGFLHSLYALQGKMVAKRELATDAIHVEQNMVRENVGSQDQIISAFGGFNRIDFHIDNTFKVTPVIMSSERLNTLNDNLLFFYTRVSRRAPEIAGDLIKNTPNRLRELDALKGIVDSAIRIINSGTSCFDDFGLLLHENWILKKSLSNGISNDNFDDLYGKAIDAGALGGKLCGAGGGGFFLFYVPIDRQQNVIKALNGLLHVPFRFETNGSQIIFFTHSRYY